MNKREFVAEHKRLVKVLKSPSHADDRKEARVQAAELAKKTKKAKKKG